MVDYRNYKVWQRSHLLVLEIYKVTLQFPQSEQSNLVSQMNRAALSIPTNIVEGCGRDTQKEFVRFLHISSGSAYELEYLILVSRDLNFIKKESAEDLLSEIGEIKKMLYTLIKKIRATLE